MISQRCRTLIAVLAYRVACLPELDRLAVPFIQPKKRTQHGVKALDVGDADAADAVELGGLQVPDVVKLGELAAVVGRDELPEFFQGLVAEVAAVDEEEDAARAGGQIYCGGTLQNPSTLLRQCVDLLARL